MASYRYTCLPEESGRLDPGAKLEWSGRRVGVGHRLFRLHRKYLILDHHDGCSLFECGASSSLSLFVSALFPGRSDVEDGAISIPRRNRSCTE